MSILFPLLGVIELAAFLIHCVVASFVGWAAASAYRGCGFGFVRNAVVGVVGSILGHQAGRVLGVKPNGHIFNFLLVMAGTLAVVYFVVEVWPKFRDRPDPPPLGS